MCPEQEKKNHNGIERQAAPQRLIVLASQSLLTEMDSQ